jgi:Transposase DDE domain
MESVIKAIESLEFRVTTLGKAKLETLKELVLGVISAKTVNLKEVCSHFSRGNPDSNYRKVQYFFANERLCERELIAYIIENLFHRHEPLTLAIDRTDWAFGQTRHNLLCVSVLYKNTAIPLILFPLERKGNSHSGQRISLIKTLLSVIPVRRIKAILGDREFIGDEWLENLKDLQVPFVMRQRNNTIIACGDYLGTIEAFVKEKTATEHGRVHIGTQMFELSTIYSGDNLVAVISNDVHDPLAHYKQRWGIETGFKCLKTNGFNLEDTHLKHPERITLLVQICAISMCVSFASIPETIEPIVKKNTDTSPFHILHKLVEHA